MNIELLQQICFSLPAVTEYVKWDNDLCFSADGKMFCVASLEVPLSVSFKVPDEDFDAFVSHEGFKPAPYMARAKWVTVTDISTVKPMKWPVFDQQSCTLVCFEVDDKGKAGIGN